MMMVYHNHVFKGLMCWILFEEKNIYFDIFMLKCFVRLCHPLHMSTILNSSGTFACGALSWLVLCSILLKSFLPFINFDEFAALNKLNIGFWNRWDLSVHLVLKYNILSILLVHLIHVISVLFCWELSGVALFLYLKHAPSSRLRVLPILFWVLLPFSYELRHTKDSPPWGKLLTSPPSYLYHLCLKTKRLYSIHLACWIWLEYELISRTIVLLHSA